MCSSDLMLRGQYAHNTGVHSNEGTAGGFSVVHDEGLESSTVATWLRDAGYRTGLVGKYLNRYPQGAGPTYVPPGWDTWVSPVGSSEAGYDYTLNHDGRLVAYGDAPEDYATTVFVDETIAFAARSVEAGDPFFAWMAVDAPHEPGVAAPEDVGTYDDRRAPRSGAFDRVDPSAPDWVRDLPPLSAADREEIDDRYRGRSETLRSLDRELARLADELDGLGVLDDTYVVLISDNGFHLGQHRLKAGKQSAYEEDVRVPLLVRGPGVPAGATSDALVANVDLPPTFAELAGADVPDFVDGRSLAPLFGGDEDAPAADRAAVLLEHWVPVFTTDGGDVDQDALIDAIGVPEAGVRGEGPSPPDYAGLRTRRYTYVEYVTGEVELYDNEADPDQVRNLAATAPRELLDRLAARLAALEGCAGASCRAAEAVPVP